MANYFSSAVSGAQSVLQGNTISGVGTIIFGGGQAGAGGEPTPSQLKEAINALGQIHPRFVLEELRLDNQVAKGTCKWILKDEVFKEWSSGEHSSKPFVWVCGPPKMGKTTLAMFINEYLQETQTSADDDHKILYYFCGSQRSNRVTSTDILKSFIYQLCEKSPVLARELCELWQHSQGSILQPHQIEPSWWVLRQAINESGVRRVSCIIDGIERCNDKHMEHFLKRFRAIFTRGEERAKKEVTSETDEQQPGLACPKVPELRMMVLSAEEPDCIPRLLEDVPRIDLQSVNSHQARSDLEVFVQHSAETVSASCSKGKEPSKEMTELVSQGLSDGKHRDFLCVRLASEIMASMSQKQIKVYVKNIPESAEDIYIQILLEAPSQQRAQVAAVLQWVTLSAKPLSKLELRKAVKYTTGGKSADARALKKALKALKACEGLVTLQHDLVNQQQKQVVLASQAVRDLLLAKPSRLRQKKELRDFIFDESSGHSTLANVCIKYLETSKTMDRARKIKLKPSDNRLPYFDKHSFLEYAMAYWTFHAEHGDVEKTAFAGSFFKPRSTQFQIWWESYWISLRQSFAWKWTTPGDFSPLHIAAFFNIVPLARHVEQQGLFPQLQNAEDHQGMKPINRAVERSNAAMVKFPSRTRRLRRGSFAQDRTRNPRARSPASPASEFGNPFKQMRSQTLNSIASWSKKLDGSAEDPSSPISPGVKSFRDAKSEKPLHIAARCGHVDAVRLLLQCGADPLKATDIGWTPLQYAAFFGRIQVAELLIAEGADGRVRESEQLTPLHCAVMNDQPDIVECLLSKKAVDVEAIDNLGYTAFQTACRSNNIPIMDTLLDYGAKINQPTKTGLNALHLAAIEGHLDVVKWLLKHGVDVRSELMRVSKETGRAIHFTALSLARGRGHESIARMLEKYGPSESTATTAEVDESVAELTKGSYSVPVLAVPDTTVHTIEQDPTAEQDEAVDLSESDEDSDGDSDSEVRVRKQSAGGLENSEDHHKTSAAAPLGLGLDAGSEPQVGSNVVENTATQLSMEDNNVSTDYQSPTPRIERKMCAAMLQNVGYKVEDNYGPHSTEKQAANGLEPAANASQELTIDDPLTDPHPVDTPLLPVLDGLEQLENTSEIAIVVNIGPTVDAAIPELKPVDTPLLPEDSSLEADATAGPPMNKAEAGTFSRFGEKFVGWRNDAAEAGKSPLGKLQQFRSPKLQQGGGERSPQTSPSVGGDGTNDDANNEFAHPGPPSRTRSFPAIMKSGRSMTSGMTSWRRKSSAPGSTDEEHMASLPNVAGDESGPSSGQIEEEHAVPGAEEPKENVGNSFVSPGPPPRTGSFPAVTKSGRSISSAMPSWRRKSSEPGKEDNERSTSLPGVAEGDAQEPLTGPIAEEDTTAGAQRVPSVPSLEPTKASNVAAGSAQPASKSRFAWKKK
ncbi:hypothetical protein TI39_contig4275g00007 [Zymoseptoria brevis]|uniref:Nephrocystin 3-like N-terminal domain-containing protein n=1 Tax=Zymoseptoria brevis TaxID=1047168 RepID=A0A0F4G9H7_9PEZI|nr:hypothetical protein TI39_contig4275g00007 [Zymoseptoria brevis]